MTYEMGKELQPKQNIFLLLAYF